MNASIRNLSVAALLVTSVIQTSLPARADDWPQWRGPDRTGKSKETGLLKSWPEGGPKQLWLFKDAGLGYAGFSIVNGRLFTLGARGDKEFLIAVDANSGQQLWSLEVGALYKNNWGDGPRATPTVDGDRVYAMGGHGDLVCAKVADGSQVWKVSMIDQLGGKLQSWGYTESVLVDGGNVICTPGGSKGAIAALDKMTGKLVWQTKDFTDEAQYSSVITGSPNGEKQYIQLVMKNFVGVSPKDGKVLWKAPFPGRTAVIPTPVCEGDQVYVTAGYGVGSKSVKIGKDNSVTDLYENKVMKNHHGGVILVDGHIYGFSDAVGWVCQDFKTGEEVWAEKAKLKKGPLTYAEGMFYCLEEDSGTVVLIEASTKGWNEHGRFKMEPQSAQRVREGRIWAHPVVANGKLYLRDQELLFCYDVKAK